MRSWTTTTLCIAAASLSLACAPESGDDSGLDNDAIVEPPVFAPLGNPDDPVPTVSEVDVERYLGTWYEIATYPIFFQQNCARTTATYGIRDEGGLSVFNQCRLGGIEGEPFSFTGKALPTDDTFAKLDVSFFGDRGAPYWVIELDGGDSDAPYDWVLVSDPTMGTLWILHRAPVMDEVLLEPLIERLEARGYDTEALSFTAQPEEAYDPVADG